MMMDTDSVGTSKSNKRSFVEALREFSSQQTTPAPKRVNIDLSATDTVRIEVNKVPQHFIIVSQHEPSQASVYERFFMNW